MSPSPSRRLWTRLLIGILLLAGWVVFWRTVVEPAGDPDVFSIPARGQARAEFLADGTPVWVVHHEDGNFTVVEALSPHQPLGIGILVGWCPSGRGFSDPRGGAWFNERGQYLAGPAPHGLVPRRFQLLEDDPPRLRIEAAQDPEPRGVAVTPLEGLGHRPCTYTSPEATPQFPQMILSDLSPEEVLTQGLECPIAIRAVLHVRRDGASMLCSQESPVGECQDGAPAEGIQSDFEAVIGRSAGRIWIVRAGDAALRQLIAVPDPGEPQPSR